MIKRTLIACMILAASARTLYAGEPYIGGGFGINLSRYMPGIAGDLFAGYGDVVDQKGRFYIGGEMGAEILLENYNTYFFDPLNPRTFIRKQFYHPSYSLKASFIPGLNISDKTMIYGRLGLQYNNFYNFHTVANPLYYSTPLLGIGIKTKVKKNLSVRAELLNHGNTYSNQLNVGLLYNFW